ARRHPRKLRQVLILAFGQCEQLRQPRLARQIPREKLGEYGATRVMEESRGPAIHSNLGAASRFSTGSTIRRPTNRDDSARTGTTARRASGGRPRHERARGARSSLRTRFAELAAVVVVQLVPIRHPIL